MINKHIFFLLGYIFSVNTIAQTDASVVASDGEMEKKSCAFDKRDYFRQNLTRFFNDCKIQTVIQNQSLKEIRFKSLRNADEACACFKAASYLDNAFKYLNPADQKSSQQILNSALSAAEEAIFEKSTVAHSAIYKKFYDEGLISKEEYETFTKAE